MKTVLVIEDEDIVRRVITRRLLRSGCQVLEAANAREALEHVQQRGVRPDLVITDVLLPDLDGQALLQKIRTHQPNARALFMSGYSADILRQKGLLSEGDLFLEKTMVHTHLDETLDQLLNP